MSRIVRFEAENFKRLKVVRIDPDTNTVVVAGRNAQGKSSVLDAIHAALAGKAGVKEITRPIRDGETKARVVLELDDIKVERKWTQSGSTLTVGPRSGSSKFNSPQAVLDSLIGSLSFDPLAFAQADAKTQRAQLLQLSGLQDEIDALDQTRKAAYDERTDVNRDLRRYEAKVGPDVLEPVEQVNTATVVDELGIARQRILLQTEWSRLNDEMKVIQNKMADVARRGRELPGTRDELELVQILASADRTNEQAAEYEQWVENGRLRDDARHASDDLTDRIRQLDEEKVDALKNADLPVEGLSVDDEGVLYNGVPFTQASASERLRVSVAMAMAANPEVRVICIKDASLLDDDSFAMIVKMARDNDFQVWYEQVAVADNGLGVIIEDGEVQDV